VVGRFDAARVASTHEHHHHDAQACRDSRCAEHHRPDHVRTFSTWSYETDQPLALEALRETMRKLPGTVYRAKGVVYSTAAPQRRAVLQVVGRRVDISLQDEWGERTPRTRIVVIGAANGIDPVMLGHQFNMTELPNRGAGRRDGWRDAPDG
jgi:G3E family GTPase